MRIVVLGGGTGLIGKRLAEMLKANGDEVRILSRKPEKIKSYKGFAWDAKKMTIDPDALQGATHVINLAGAGIADAKWTAERKKLIIESRTSTTKLLRDEICKHTCIQAYISASAIGYYGNKGDQWVKEQDLPGDGFLSESTLAWEDAVKDLAKVTGVRTCYLRTGIALSTEGGALEKMLQPAKLGVSGYFGNGQQWYSWIHLEDLCKVYIKALDDDRYVGAINAVAPNPVRNKTLASVLAKALKNPALVLPVPAFGLKLVFGEMSHTILDSARVSASFLTEELGFSFLFPDIESALFDLC